MSAPDTNLPEQERQHRGPLAGIRLALIFAAVLLVLFLGYVFAMSDGTDGSGPELGITPSTTGSAVEAIPAN